MESHGAVGIQQLLLVVAISAEFVSRIYCRQPPARSTHRFIPDENLFLRYQLVVKFIHEMLISFSQWCFYHNHEPSELSIACIGIFANAIECLEVHIGLHSD